METLQYCKYSVGAPLPLNKQGSIRTPQNSPPGKQNNLFMGPTVKADLKALQRAQVYGQVAGADVSIKFQTKYTSQPASPSTQ
jgi:hypothetical protein